MKKLLGPLAAAAILFASGVAFGDEATGRIQSLNAESQEITLDSGLTFSMGEGVSIEGLNAGDEVQVTYEEREGEKIATKIARPEN